MQKRKYLGLLFMATVAFAMQFWATGVGADCTVPTCFQAGGYEVRTVEPFPTQNNDGSTTFNYTVMPLPGTSKNVSTIDILAPVCNLDYRYNGPDNTIGIWTGDPNGWRSYPPGTGSSNTSYAFGVYQVYVFEQSFNSFGPFYLHTTKADLGVTSMGLKIGATLYAGEILGPACYLYKIATTTSQKIQLNPKNPDQYITVTFNTDGSVVSVTAHKNGQDVPLAWHDLSELGEVNGLPVTYMPDGAIMKTSNTDDPCYNYFNGTRYCQTCY
jgi:hypothetical protein